MWMVWQKQFQKLNRLRIKRSFHGLFTFMYTRHLSFFLILMSKSMWSSHIQEPQILYYRCHLMERDLAEDLERHTSINWLKILDAGQKMWPLSWVTEWRERVIKSRASSTWWWPCISNRQPTEASCLKLVLVFKFITLLIKSHFLLLLNFILLNVLY